MENNSTPQAQWRAMTEEQKIEWIAVKVMGWEMAWHSFDGKCYYKIGNDVKGVAGQDWNPLTDHNDFRMVEEQVMENGKLTLAFTNILTDYLPKDTSLLIGFETMWLTYCSLGLPECCEALYIAYQAIHGK
jgi:hypothetical protein